MFMQEDFESLPVKDPISAIKPKAGPTIIGFITSSPDVTVTLFLS